MRFLRRIATGSTGHDAPSGDGLEALYEGLAKSPMRYVILDLTAVFQAEAPAGAWRREQGPAYRISIHSDSGEDGWWAFYAWRVMDPSDRAALGAEFDRVNALLDEHEATKGADVDLIPTDDPTWTEDRR